MKLIMPLVNLSLFYFGPEYRILAITLNMQFSDAKDKLKKTTRLISLDMNAIEATIKCNLLKSCAINTSS